MNRLISCLILALVSGSMSPMERMHAAQNLAFFNPAAAVAEACRYAQPTLYIERGCWYLLDGEIELWRTQP